jgi:hypothetical protein
MADLEDRVAALSLPNLHPRPFSVDGAIYDGWESTGSSPEDCRFVVEEHWQTFHTFGARLFVGRGGEREPVIRIIRGLPAHDVARLAMSGAHNAGSGRDVDREASVARVVGFLQQLWHRVPFEVHSASEAELSAVFLLPIDEAEVDPLVRGIITIAPGSLSAYRRLLAELQLPMPHRKQRIRFGPQAGEETTVPDEVGAVSLYVRTASAFELHWD